MNGVFIYRRYTRCSPHYQQFCQQRGLVCPEQRVVLRHAVARKAHRWNGIVASGWHFASLNLSTAATATKLAAQQGLPPRGNAHIVLTQVHITLHVHVPTIHVILTANHNHHVHCLFSQTIRLARLLQQVSYLPRLAARLPTDHPESSTTKDPRGVTGTSGSLSLANKSNTCAYNTKSSFTMTQQFLTQAKGPTDWPPPTAIS